MVFQTVVRHEAPSTAQWHDAAGRRRVMVGQRRGGDNHNGERDRRGRFRLEGRRIYWAASPSAQDGPGNPLPRECSGATPPFASYWTGWSLSVASTYTRFQLSFASAMTNPWA